MVHNRGQGGEGVEFVNKWLRKKASFSLLRRVRTGTGRPLRQRERNICPETFHKVCRYTDNHTTNKSLRIMMIMIIMVIMERQFVHIRQLLCPMKCELHT